MQQSGRRGCKSLPTCSGVPMVPPPSLQHTAEWQTWVQVPPHLQRCADGATTFSSTCSRVADVGGKSLPTCSGVPMVPPPSLQNAAEWQTWVQIPPHLQRCVVGAITFSSTCSRVADVGASPSPPAAVCPWCHHLLCNTAPSQRRRDTPRGPEVSLSGSRPSPVDQWHSLQSCVQTRTRRWRALPHRRSQNPNPAALVAFLRALPPLCSPHCLRAAVAAPRAAFCAFVRPSSPSCGPRRLCAALAAFVRPLPPLMRPSAPLCGPRCLLASLAVFLRPSPSSCGPRLLRAVLAAFMWPFLLTSTH